MRLSNLGALGFFLVGLIMGIWISIIVVLIQLDAEMKQRTVHETTIIR